MKTKIASVLILAVLSGLYQDATAQNKDKEGIQYNFNETGSHYVKFTFTNQTWLRYNENNPGSTVAGDPQSATFDIGLRRTRMQVYGQITDKVFFYTQFGQNNFNYLSPRKTGAFFHDVVAEYKVHKDNISLGAGLTGWSGLSRYSSPAVSSILAVDAPLFAQTTNDVNDQFLRKLSVYAKGKLGRLDYRLVASTPMALQNSAFYTAAPSQYSTFSARAPKMELQGYVKWDFFDKESNLMPYMAGTYLGKKKVLNIGAGIQYQQNAMWSLEADSSVAYNDMLLWSVDAFYDAPINKEKNTAITAYAAYYHFDFGPGYIRNIGPMNPTSGVIASQASFNGPGNNYPQLGTGSCVYAQAGFLLPNNLLGQNNGQLQPYAALQWSNYDRLNSAFAAYNIGFNWLIKGHNSKISFDYGSRPVFDASTLKETTRKGSYILQYQFSI